MAYLDLTADHDNLVGRLARYLAVACRDGKDYGKDYEYGPKYLHLIDEAHRALSNPVLPEEEEEEEEERPLPKLTMRQLRVLYILESGSKRLLHPVGSDRGSFDELRAKGCVDEWFNVTQLGDRVLHHAVNG